MGSASIVGPQRQHRLSFTADARSKGQGPDQSCGPAKAAGTGSGHTHQPQEPGDPARGCPRSRGTRGGRRGAHRGRGCGTYSPHACHGREPAFRWRSHRRLSARIPREIAAGVALIVVDASVVIGFLDAADDHHAAAVAALEASASHDSPSPVCPARLPARGPTGTRVRAWIYERGDVHHRRSISPAPGSAALAGDRLPMVHARGTMGERPCRPSRCGPTCESGSVGRRGGAIHASERGDRAVRLEGRSTAGGQRGATPGGAPSSSPEPR